MYASASEMDFSASDIGNQLIVYDCQLGSPGYGGYNTDSEEKYPPNLFSIRSQQSVLINRITSKGIFLEEAEVHGDLILLGNTLSSVDARFLTVTGALGLGDNDGPPPKRALWTGDAFHGLNKREGWLYSRGGND
jgi:hypothetical protein